MKRMLFLKLLAIVALTAIELVFELSGGLLAGEPAMIALAARPGTPIQELIAAAGPPDGSGPVPSKGPAPSLCEGKDDVLELGYDFPKRGLLGWIDRITGASTSASVSVCVDKANGVTSTSQWVS